MKTFLVWATARLKEPSTWAALAPIFGLLGWSIDSETGMAIGAGLSALLGVILKEKGQAKNLIALVAVTGLLGLTVPLVGCASTSPADVAAAREKALSIIDKGYTTITIAAVACIAAEVPPCDKPDVVDGITKAQSVLDLAVDKAKANIQASADSSAVDIAMRAALDALAIYAKAVKVYKIGAG